MKLQFSGRSTRSTTATCTQQLHQGHLSRLRLREKRSAVRAKGSNFSSPLSNFKIKSWWTVAQLSALKPVNFAVWLSYGQFCLHIIRIVFERAWGLCVTWFSCSSTSWLAEPTMTFYWCCGQPPSTLFGSVVFQMTMMFPFALVFVVLTN